MDKKYDFFISHASEDKETVARPLAQKLSGIGLSVWFDEFTLNIGDSISESIDKGLSQSDYALVILSHNFFAKNWPRRELAGLVARETIQGERIIFPIWHNLTAKEVLSYSPPLADIKALSTNCDYGQIGDSVLKLLAKPKWADTTMSPEDIERDSIVISALVYSFLGMQDLLRIKEHFPEAIQPNHFKQIMDSLRCIIESHRPHPKLKEYFTLYDSLSFQNGEASLQVSMMTMISISFCKNTDKLWAPPVLKGIQARIKALSLFLPQELETILKSIEEIKVFYCRTPHYGSGENPIERRIAVVSKYWEFLRLIFIYQSQAPIGFAPHPLSRLISSIRQRIIDNLVDIKGEQNVFISNIDTICECLLSGDQDIFSIDDWINEILAKTEEELIELKNKFGPEKLTLTEPEETFFSVLEDSIRRWKDRTSTEWEKILQRIDMMKKKE